jgi:hypothetical protein
LTGMERVHFIGELGVRGWEKTETDERVELLLEKLVVKIVITKRKIAKPRIATIFLFENFILFETIYRNLKATIIFYTTTTFYVTIITNII